MQRVWVMILAFLFAACSVVDFDQPGSAGDQTENGFSEEQQATGEDLPISEDKTQTRQPLQANLEDLGPAPELVNTVWLNTDQPLRLADLRGKVVLLDMWTFG